MYFFFRADQFRARSFFNFIDACFGTDKGSKIRFAVLPDPFFKNVDKVKFFGDGVEPEKFVIAHIGNKDKFIFYK